MAMRTSTPPRPPSMRPPSMRPPAEMEAPAGFRSSEPGTEFNGLTGRPRDRDATDCGHDLTATTVQVPIKAITVDPLFWQMQELVKTIKGLVDGSSMLLERLVLQEIACGRLSLNGLDRAIAKGAQHKQHNEALRMVRKNVGESDPQGDPHGAAQEIRQNEAATLRLEVRHLWPGPSGVNTADTTFGWNILMHAAVQDAYVLVRFLLYDDRKDHGTWPCMCKLLADSMDEVTVDEDRCPWPFLNVALDLRVKLTRSKKYSSQHPSPDGATDDPYINYKEVDDLLGSTVQDLIGARSHLLDRSGAEALDLIKYRERKAKMLLSRARQLVTPYVFFDTAEKFYISIICEQGLLCEAAYSLLRLYLVKARAVDRLAIKYGEKVLGTVYTSDQQAAPEVQRFTTHKEQVGRGRAPFQSPACPCWQGLSRDPPAHRPPRPALRNRQVLVHCKKARAAFDLWKSADQALLAMGVDRTSHLFIMAMELYTRNGYTSDQDSVKQCNEVEWRITAADVEPFLNDPVVNEVEYWLIEERRYVAEEMMWRLSGKSYKNEHNEEEKGVHVLDFTAQNDSGQTSRMLLGYEEKSVYAKLPFSNIPLAVNASTPFFKHGKASLPETLKHFFAPALYIFGVIGYYADLILDIAVTAELWGQKKYAFAYFTGLIMCLGFVMHSIMDVMSHYSLKTCSPKEQHVATTTEQQAGSVSVWSFYSTAQRSIQAQILMNLLHIRILDETRIAFLEWRDPRMPTQPRASYYQVKLVEGIFEALPQAILQTYVFVDDLASGGTVTLLRIISLTTSYLSFSASLATMGIRIRGWWRSTFFGLCLSQALLRAFSITALALLTNGGAIFWLYMVFSSAATFFFVAVLQNWEAFHCGLSTTVISWIAFFVPIELDSFAVLRSAQPRAAKLPFFAFRFTEMFVFCLIFWLKYDDAQCVGAVNLNSQDGRFTAFAEVQPPEQQCCKESCGTGPENGNCCSWLNLLQSVDTPLKGKMAQFIREQQVDNKCLGINADPMSSATAHEDDKYTYSFFMNSTTLNPAAESVLVSTHSRAHDKLPNIWLELPWSDPPTMEYNGWCTNHLGNVCELATVSMQAACVPIALLDHC